MENEVEHVEARPVTDIVEQMQRADIDIQIKTAQQYPKHSGKDHLMKVKKSIMEFATLDEETAAACFYTLPRSGKAIQGPSVRLAEIAVHCYGNIRDSVRTVEVVPRGPNPHVVVQAMCHDLETNVAVCIEKRRRVTKKKKNAFPDEDDVNLAVNSCASIAFRDAAFKVIPQALIKPVWEKCKQVAIGQAKSIVETRTKCIDRLNKMGVPTDRILNTLGVRDAEGIMKNELELLFGLGTAIKDGDCTIEEAFPPIKTEAEDEGKSTADRITDHFDDSAAKADDKKKRKNAQRKKANKKEEPPPPPPEEKTADEVSQEVENAENAGIAEDLKQEQEEELPPEEPKGKPAYRCTKCKRKLATTEVNEMGNCKVCLGKCEKL